MKSLIVRCVLSVLVTPVAFLISVALSTALFPTDIYSDQSFGTIIQQILLVDSPAILLGNWWILLAVLTIPVVMSFRIRNAALVALISVLTGGVLGVGFRLLLG